MWYATTETPLGTILVGSNERGLTAVRFGGELPPEGALNADVNAEPLRQLQEYFKGQRTGFELQIDLVGTDFQRAVWQQLLQIPYGETCCYADIAARLNKPGASRAVGMANHNNPIAIVVPCHRVIGRDGALTGYAGGIHLKQKLLAIEKQPRTLFT